MTSHQAVVAATIILLPILHLLIRIAPIWRDRRRGCDAYYFLLTAEEFRKRKRLPITLPLYYLLEPQEMAYPPGLSIILGLLPDEWLKRYYWALSPVIDIVPLGLLGVWVGSSYGIAWAWPACLAYSANSSLLLEFSSLTSRTLGLALGSAFLLFAFSASQHSIAALALAIMIGVLLLYTHKMSIQLLWFLSPFLAITSGNPIWLVPLPAAYLIALAIAPRLFVLILRAHWDIVSFWNRNWALLGAHVIRRSPIYGSGEGSVVQDVGYYRQHDLSWIWSRIRKILDYNCFVLFLPFVAIKWADLTALERFAFVWVVGTYLWGVATYLIPPLRCLGEGNKYFKYAIVPSLVMTVAVLNGNENALAWVLAGGCAIWTAYAYIRGVRAVRGAATANTGRLTPSLTRIFDRLKAVDGARIMCLPLHLCDLAAYHTRRPVLWGTHGLGFKEAEPLFPVMLRPIDDFVRNYQLTHLVLDEDYVSSEELRLHGVRRIVREANYSLWAFGDAAVSSMADSASASEA